MEIVRKLVPQMNLLLKEAKFAKNVLMDVLNVAMLPHASNALTEKFKAMDHA